MSGLQRLFNYCKQNPAAFYLGGGFALHCLRTLNVNNAYQQHFARFDVERKRELDEYLATHQAPAQ